MRAPLFSDLADAPAGGQAHWRDCHDGVRIRLAHWTAPSAKGTVLLCPGRTEYIEKYGRSVRAFTEAGLSVVVNDWRGQGLADRLVPNRLIGHVDRFSDFQHDIAEIIAYATEMDLPKPWHLLAHSMGGCIGLRALMNGLPVETVTFSGPMWGIEFSPWLRVAAWVVTTLGNPLPLRDHFAPGADAQPMDKTGAFETNLLTGDAEYYRYMNHQTAQCPSLALAGPSIGWLHGALREMLDMTRQPSPETKCLCFLGTREDIVDPKRIHQRMDRWENGRLIIVDGGRHEVMMETQSRRDQFYRETLAHMGV